MGLCKIRTALISVSDKSNLVSFSQGLMEFNIDVLSTGGTYRMLKEADVQIKEVSDHTGFPEMMDGRVKTLHPKIHGGLLGRRDNNGGGIDADVMNEHDITAIDLVVVNLYPFEKTIADKSCSFADAIENIDIGGPAMVRSAAKNFASVAVVVDTADYSIVLEEMRETEGCLSEETRFRLAVKAFEQIEHNISVLKAGMTFREVSEKCWPIPDEFLANRYTTLIHGVGLADEYPNIIHCEDFDDKGYDGLIEVGMTLCVESVIGSEGGSECVKLEEQIIMTETGVERQSSYPFAMEML